jgi:hypothetical protein
MQKFTRSLLAVGAVIGLAACGDDVTVTPPPAAPAPTVTAVTVSPGSTSIKVGETVIFSAALTTTGTVTNTAVTWSSANAAIASVNGTSGAVTGVAVGTTTIRATSSANASATGAGSVTVTAPGVQSVSVTPSAAAVTVGQSFTAVANVTRDAGVAGTVTWLSSAPAIATVSATGVVTGAAAGTAVVTATSTADVTKAASLSVTVTQQANALQSLTVTPATVAIGPGGTLVLTTIAQAAAGATVTYANSSSNTAAATVSAAGGNPTITGVSNGTAVITITATGTGAGLSTNSISQTVTVNISAASVSISSLTNCVNGTPTVPCTVVPVNLAGVTGQLEATLTLASGSQTIDSVTVSIGSVQAASQVFGVNGAPAAPVTLSMNTAGFNATTYVPKWINGPQTLVAKIYPHGAASPTASNTVQFTLINADVVYFDATGLAHTGNSANDGFGNIWWKGGFTYKSHPVSYSGQIATITYTSSSCGASAGSTAPSYQATFSCGGVEGSQAIGSALTVTYNAGYTLSLPPTAFMTAISAGFVPGSPVYAAVSSNEDNKGPSVSSPSFSNGLYSYLSDLWAGSGTSWYASVSDGGVGVASSTAIMDVSSNGGASWSPTNVNNPLTLAETVTGTGYIVSGEAATDLLGNTGSRGGGSYSFGVDLVVLDAQYADRVNSGAVLTTIFPLVQKGTIYAETTPTLANPSWTTTNDGLTEMVAVDAIDTRSGLDNPNAQVSSLIRRTAGGASACPISGASNMSTILVDNYVQTSTPAQLDCGLAAGSRVGYYTWTASVRDRAGNQRGITTDGSTPLDSVYMAIDELAPNMTGLGFQTTLYVGGQPANYSISANDDLELKDGQVALAYAGMSSTIVYGYSSTAYTSAAFGVPFDATITNVVNGANLTLAYYVSNWDFVTAAVFVPGPAPSGNIAGFTSSGINNAAIASVRDMANQVGSLLAPVPVLSTQLSPRGSAPAYGGTNMIHWRIFPAPSGGIVTVEHVGSTSNSTPFCDRVEIFESDVAAANGDAATVPTTLTYRATAAATAIPFYDNGFQRFWTYKTAALSPAIPANSAVAACFKNGSALFSRLG